MVVGSIHTPRVCGWGVRNNGQHSDIFRPFWHFVRHLAVYYSMFIS